MAGVVNCMYIFPTVCDNSMTYIRMFSRYSMILNQSTLQWFYSLTFSRFYRGDGIH